MAGWKIPDEWRGLASKITYKWSIFQHAMFDYQRVAISISAPGVELFSSTSSLLRPVPWEMLDIRVHMALQWLP